MNRNARTLLRIFPGLPEQVALEGLYLREPFAPPAERSRSFVYANYISSLDGRISLPHPRTLKRGVPPAIANDRDWRLFQELAAGADAVLVSGRYARDLEHEVSSARFPVSTKAEYADLLRWRHTLALTPQPAAVIVSSSLDLPPLRPLVESGRAVYVATGDAADPQRAARLEADGVRVLRVGAGTRAEGRKLIDALAQESLRNIAMIGGGAMLHALAADDALDRLYLTFACSLLGGLAFDTLLAGPELAPAQGLRLKALHYDAEAPEGATVEQLFAIFDRTPPRSR